MVKDEYWIAPLLEAALIVTVALCGWLTHRPLVFASLGPTAFEVVETPDRPTARLYNIIVGNLIALIAAYGALSLTRLGRANCLCTRCSAPSRVGGHVGVAPDCSFNADSEGDPTGCALNHTAGCSRCHADAERWGCHYGRVPLNHPTWIPGEKVAESKGKRHG